MRLLRPRALDEALALLAMEGARPLAGGTDIYPALAARPDARPLVDLTAVPGLAGIHRDGDVWRFGALTRWSDITRAALPPGFAALQQAAKEVGGWQIQNSGTLGGNLCNASPAADGAPVLLALDAEVELASRTTTRRLPLGDFLLGNRRTALDPGEMLSAILLPDPGAAVSCFIKLGQRASLVISIAMVACLLEAEEGRVARAALAIGACSAVAQRLPALEAALVGQPLSAAAQIASAAHLAHLTPIDDVRASAEYRRASALELTRRALAQAAKAAAHA